MIDVVIELEDPIEKDKINVRFEEQELEVLALCGRTLWVLSIPRLYKKIIPDRCKFKVPYRPTCHRVRIDTP